MSQGYVSHELTHFVGRGKTPQQALGILQAILREQRLWRPPGVGGPEYGGILIRRGGSLSREELITGDWVCFCDIPKEHFGVHTRKYGYHGIAFSKKFLVEHGANPVLYVEGQSPAHFPMMHWEVETALKEGHDPRPLGRQPRGEGFDRVLNTLASVVPGPPPGVAPAPWLRDILEGYQVYKALTEFHLLAYLKFFDSSLSDENPENYYMEREWRVIGDVRFRPEDIARVYAPVGDVEALEAEFPTLEVESHGCGQLEPGVGQGEKSEQDHVN